MFCIPLLVTKLDQQKHYLPKHTQPLSPRISSNFLTNTPNSEGWVVWPRAALRRHTHTHSLPRPRIARRRQTLWLFRSQLLRALCRRGGSGCTQLLRCLRVPPLWKCRSPQCVLATVQDNAAASSVAYLSPPLTAWITVGNTAAHGRTTVGGR